MRPTSNPPIPQIFPDFPAAVAPAAAVHVGTIAPVQLPPRVGKVYRFSTDEGPLTPQTYLEGLAAGKLKATSYLDFMLLGVVPKVDVAPWAVINVVGRLVDSEEFPALEFLLERCGPLSSLELNCEHLFCGRAEKLADILHRTQPGISNLNYEDFQLFDRYGCQTLKVVIDACPRLTTLQLGTVDCHAVNALAEVIRFLPTMTDLAIDELTIDDEATGKAFCEALTSASALSTFHLGNLNAPDQVKTDLLQCLTNPSMSKRIVRLSLNVGNFAAAHLDQLRNLLRQCPVLDYLILKSCSEILLQIEALCTTLKEAPGRLQGLYLEFDWPPTKFSKAEINVLTDTARCRTGLRGIFGAYSIHVTPLDKKEFEPWPGHIHEDYGHYKDAADVVWARFDPYYAPLVDLLARNEALHLESEARIHAADLARADLPLGPYNLEKDSGSLLARHILAHSDSVQQFREVMNEVADALKEKNSSIEQQAPTSTASNAPTTNSTQDHKA